MNKEELIVQLEELMRDEENPINGVVRLLSINDEEFEVLAPPILESFKKNLNNPTDRVAITQAFNASGAKIEDIISEMNGFFKELDEMKNLSQQKRDFLKEVLSSTFQAISETEGISKRLIPVPIELCHPNAKIPQYAHESDSGLDVYALDDYTIHPGEIKLIPTGFKVALPPGYEFQVRPKSGLSLKTKLRISNSPGTIDSGYRDEIGIIVENTDFPICEVNYYPQSNDISCKYGTDMHIGKGEKFCQLVLSEVPKAAFYVVDNVLEVDKTNRNGGFGSTGLKDNE